MATRRMADDLPQAGVHDPGQRGDLASLACAVRGAGAADHEGQAGAIAVAVAAATLPSMELVSAPETLEAWAAHVPATLVRERILEARAFPADDPKRVAQAVGSGLEMLAQDTVPFCLWMAANCRDYETALWRTAWTSGDVDTTCAIVGGILANAVEALPAHWLARREPLPAR